MWRWLLLPLLFAAACSKGPQADLQYIKQARTVAAEWALVNEQAAKGKLTQPYVGSMHKWARQQIESAAAGLTQPDSAYGQTIRTLLAQPNDAAPEELRAKAETLESIEKNLESA